MKIRNGYVSNSSSSSYIVEFKNYDQVIRIAGEEITPRVFFDLVESGRMETEMHDLAIHEEEKTELIKHIEYLISFTYDNNQKCELIKLRDDIEKNLYNENTNYARFELGYHDTATNFLFRLLWKYDMFKIRDQSES